MDKVTRLKTKREYDEQIVNLKGDSKRSKMRIEYLEYERDMTIACPCCSTICEIRGEVVLETGLGCEGCDGDGWITALDVKAMFGLLTREAKEGLGFVQVVGSKNGGLK